MEARRANDPAAISLASKQVIALGLAQTARLRLEAKAYKKAIELCRESLEFEDNSRTRVDLAIVNLYANKPADALEQASLATEKDPLNSLAWQIKGQALLQELDYTAAVSALERANGLKPDAESSSALGIAYLGLQEKEKASKAFSQTLDLVGDHGWSRVLVGRAYQQHGLLDEAQGEFRQALQLDPLTPNAHYFWAVALLQDNGWNPNEDVYSHLHAELRRAPRHFESNYLLGFLASAARNYKESDRYLRLASESNPASPETWLYLGMNEKSRGASRTAEFYFRKAIQVAKNFDPKQHLKIREAYFVLGRMLMTSGRSEEGQKLLAKAREYEQQSLGETRKRTDGSEAQENSKMGEADKPYIPDLDANHRYSLATNGTSNSGSEENTASHPHASRSLSPAQRKTERHLGTILGAAFNDLATAEALQEKYPLAYKHYREAASWDARIPGLQRNLGLAAFFAGQPSEAVQLLSKVVAQAPSDAHARAVLGMAYVATQNFPMGVQTITPIANQALQDSQLGFAWTKSLLKTGNRAGAVRALQGLEKANVNLTLENLIQLGQLWQELGEAERATEYFRRVLEIDPENTDAKCALHLSKCP